MKQVIFFVLFSLLSSYCLSSSYSKEDLKRDTAEFSRLAADNKWREAAKIGARAYEGVKVLYGKESKNRAAATHNYGAALVEAYQYDQAIKVLKEAIDLHKQIYGKSGVELVPVFLDLGRAYSLSKHTPNTSVEKPKFYSDKALRIVKREYGDNSIEWAQTAFQVGDMLLHHARTQSAKKYIEKAGKIFKRELGDTHYLTGKSAFLLGKYELAVGEEKPAIEHLNSALVAFDSDSPSVDTAIELTTRAFLIQAYERSGDSEAATEHCMRIGQMTPFSSVQDYKPVYKPLAEYPKAALKKGKEGYAIVEYDVDKNGFTKNHQVVEVKGPEDFGITSLAAAKKYRYAPAFHDGEPVITQGVRTKNYFTLVD